MIRISVSTITVICLLLQPTVFAQVMVSPKLKPPKVAAPPQPKVLTLHPMGAPDPLLRYRLWPAPEDRLNENPSPLVSRAVMLSLQLPPKTRKEFSDRFSEWHDMPIDELPRAEVHEVLNGFNAVLNELRRSENLMRIDYNLQLHQLSAPDVIQTLLPEFQEMRQLARLLQLRARLALAEHRWDDLVDDCRLAFRLSEVAAHSTDFLVGRLVGFAISGMMMGVIEEAIQRPECPNLYWALASLPEQRLFETRDSIEFESVLFARVFAAAGALPDEPIGAVAAREKIRTIVNEANMMMMNTGDRTANLELSGLLAGTYVLTLAEPSRELLASTPEWAERAKNLSASEAVLRASILKFQRLRDRWVAWSMLPPEVWDEYSAERRAAFGSDVSRTDVLQTLIRNLMPAIDAARNAGRRVNQQRNYLITVEALRMHAASTGGLPDTIDKLRPVPAWPDALTTQPFGYIVASPERATLNRSARWKEDPESTVHIELKGTK